MKMLKRPKGVLCKYNISSLDRVLFRVIWPERDSISCLSSARFSRQCIQNFQVISWVLTSFSFCKLLHHVPSNFNSEHAACSLANVKLWALQVCGNSCIKLIHGYSTVLYKHHKGSFPVLVWKICRSGYAEDIQDKAVLLQYHSKQPYQWTGTTT